VKVCIHLIAVYGILNNLCHFRTARMKTFEILKKKKTSWKTETQREQLRAWKVMPNLAKYKALLTGDNYTFLC
jgi:hypothetical protein